MKKSEVRKILEDQFKKRLKEYGFNNKGYTFLKKISDTTFFINFLFSLIDSDNSYPSQFGFCLINQRINNIFSEIFRRNNDIWLLSTNQSRLYEENKYPDLEYDIYTEEDALKMVDEVMCYMEKEALPFLESISDLKVIEKLINEKPVPEKAHVGIVLAKLMGNPEYENLKLVYKELIKDWAGDYNPDYDKIVSFLDSHSHEELIQIAGL